MEILQPIYLEREVIGYLFIQSSLQKLEHNLILMAVFMAAVLLFGLGIAMLFSRSLLGVISRPILRLSQIMKTISQEKKYDMLTPVEGTDELGQLSIGFNDMLNQIEPRDLYLEDQVRSRTHDLVAAKEAAEAANVVITDLHVNRGMGGGETAAAIIALDPAARILICSGDPGDALMCNHLEYGFRGALEKPYSLDSLAAILEVTASPA